MIIVILLGMTGTRYYRQFKDESRETEAERQGLKFKMN